MKQLQYLKKISILISTNTIVPLLCMYIPVFIDPIDGTILGTMPVIGATIPALTMPNGCVGIGCAILKAAIGTGVVFKGAIGATDGIPIPGADIGGDEETTEGPEVVSFIGEIPTGLFGNEGGCGFGGGPPVIAAKLFPEIIPRDYYFQLFLDNSCVAKMSEDLNPSNIYYFFQYIIWQILKKRQLNKHEQVHIF